MPRPNFTHFTNSQYFAAVGADVQATFGQNIIGTLTIPMMRELMQDFGINEILRFVGDELVFGNNQAENSQLILFDLRDDLEAIYAQLFNISGVNLSTVEFNLESILRDTSNIALAMGGGAPSGIGDIAPTLASYLQGILDEIFNASQITHFDLSQLVGAVASSAQGGGAAILKDDIARLPVLLAQLIQAIQIASATGDPATRQIADKTGAAALAQLVTAAQGNRLNQPDADEYADWIVNSGPFAMLKSVGLPIQLLRNFAQVFFPDVGTVLGAEIASEIATGNTVSAAVTDTTLWALGRGAEFVTKLAKKVLDTTEKMAIDLTPLMNDFWAPQFEKLLNDARDAVLALGVTSPRDGFTNAKILLSKAAINGMRAHHTASAMEMIPYAKEIGAHTVTSFMANMAGFGQIANNVWGQAIAQAVGRPAGYELNASTRSRIPDVSMLEQMVFEREMDEAEQATLLAYHGFNDDYIARIQRIQYREPNLRQLSSLAADASMTETQVGNWLQEGGFSERDVALLTPIVMQQSMRAERGTLVTEVM